MDWVKIKNECPKSYSLVIQEYYKTQNILISDCNIKQEIKLQFLYFFFDKQEIKIMFRWDKKWNEKDLPIIDIPGKKEYREHEIGIFTQAFILLENEL